MNNKKMLLFSVAALLSGSALLAQTGTNWKVGGNGLNAAGKFGTTNSQDIQFISNNAVNGLLHRTGRWGFGLSTLPSAKVQINSAADEDAFRVQVGGNTKLVLAKNGGLTVGANIINPPATGLFVQGNTGIGTSTPLSKFHVKIGSSGAAPFSLSTITTENSTSNYINILAPTSAETGLLFGHNQNNVSGGIIYNSSFGSSTTNGFQFRTNGNITRMILTKDGNLGVGADPGPYTTKISHSNSGIKLGLDIANTSEGGDWEIFARSNRLDLFGNGFFKGSFSAVDGTYSSVSDERLKENIQPMSTMLGKIAQLKAVSYQFKNNNDNQQHDGFIAQDVMKIFPALVSHDVNAARNLDVYTLNYTGFGVIAIKGIQELMKINKEKDDKIDGLQKQIDELKAVVLKGTQNNNIFDSKIKTSLTDVVLEQNTPNPFTNTTTIRYRIPQQFASAQLVVHDNNGKLIKQIKITDGGGNVNIDASMLAAGAYMYSLLVDGKIISTRQMILSK